MRAERSAWQASGQPRYQQILTILRARIMDGKAPVGSLLPTENELCAEFAVSRYTVREALRRLAEEGMVERRQGSGTHVIASAPPLPDGFALTGAESLFEFDGAVLYRGGRFAPHALDADEAELIGAEPGLEWLRAEGLLESSAAGGALCRTRLYVREQLSDLAERLRDNPIGAPALTDEHMREPIAEIIQALDTVPLSDTMAQGLDSAESGWSARLSRLYRNAQGETLLAMVNWHPIETFSYRIRLRRDAD